MDHHENGPLGQGSILGPRVSSALTVMNPHVCDVFDHDFFMLLSTIQYISMLGDFCVSHQGN